MMSMFSMMWLFSCILVFLSGFPSVVIAFADDIQFELRQWSQSLEEKQSNNLNKKHSFYKILEFQAVIRELRRMFVQIHGNILWKFYLQIRETSDKGISTGGSGILIVGNRLHQCHIYDATNCKMKFFKYQMCVESVPRSVSEN